MSDRFRIIVAAGLWGLLLLTSGCGDNAPEGDESGEAAQQEVGAQLRALEPSCGRFHSGFITDANGKSALSPVIQKRMATSATNHSRWAARVIEATGDRDADGKGLLWQNGTA